jgi:hypothetical protein
LRAYFDAYDDKGNIQQFTGKDGVITTFLWGYNQLYPVAKIIGKTYMDAISQSAINLTTVNNPLITEGNMRKELNKIKGAHKLFCNLP